MLKLFKLFNKLRPASGVLYNHITLDDRPLGALKNSGHDISRLIHNERNKETLQAVIERALKTGDLKWAVVAGKKLVSLGIDDALMLDHVENLFWANYFSEAESAFKAVSKSKVNPIQYLHVSFRIDLALRQFSSARKTLDELEVLAPELTMECLGQLAFKLISAGKYEDAKKLAEDSGAKFPAHPSIIAANIRVKMVLEGVDAALAHLSANSDALRTESENYKSIYANLILEQGRFNEAFDLLIEWLELNPKFFSLYSLANLAASHSDRQNEFGELLKTMLRRYPESYELIELRCNWSIDQNNWEDADKYLDTLRIRSSWNGNIIDLAIACQQPDVEKVSEVFSTLRTEDIRFSGPNVMLAFYIYYYRAANGGIQEARELIAPLLGERMDDSDLLALHLRLLIAQGKDEECKSFYNLLPPGLAGTASLAPFKMYFEAMSGNHTEASKGWNEFLVSSGHMSLNARSSYPKTVKLKYKEKPGDVLLFLTVFNGIEFIDWFLNYYRNLGVNHFFIVDNGSGDGTFEALSKEKDVSLFENKESFSASACGVFWTNHLMRKFGVGHWCFHVDMDEAFVFPDMEKGRSLSELLSYMDNNGYQTIPSVMLDIYPENLEISGGDDPFEKSIYIDNNYFSMRNELPPYTFIQGGIRSRLSGRSLLMTKAPLVKMTRDLAYTANNHQHTHLPVSDVSSALLHYKFIGNFVGRIDEAIERKEHFMGARFYSAMRESVQLSVETSSLLSDTSVKYTGTKQLIDLELIKTSEKWADSLIN